jgi:iron complex transport system permease protein
VTARSRRLTVVVLVLIAVVVALAVAALGWGDYPLDPAQVVTALFSTDGGFAATIVREWRAPRVVAALVFGAALAVSGALFQTLTRNPLGSPDVIGFSTGAYTGALLVITVTGSGVLSTSVGALIGGLVTAGVVYALAYRKGVQGFRLIIVGIGVTAMLHSVNTWLLLRAEAEIAMAASIWGAGSLALSEWEQLAPAALAIVVVLVATTALVAPLRQLELGDDVARAHGVRVEVTRLAVLVVGVALTAIVTAAAGPIAFVSLAAPQIARRLTRSGGLPLVPSALVGAAVLLLADVVAQHLLAGTVPVGVVTVVLGGGYLLWLVAQEARRR